MKYGKYWSQAEKEIVREAIGNWRYQGWSKGRCTLWIMERTEIARSWSACLGKFQKMIGYARKPECYYWRNK